jgi:hypothetical protein
MGILPILLFSDIEKEGGGTALLKGSHRDVARIIHEMEPRGKKGGTISRLCRGAVNFNDEDNIVEVNGEAGDVLLAHPFLLHARSKNLAMEGMVKSVRIIANPSISFKTPMRIQCKKLGCPCGLQSPSNSPLGCSSCENESSFSKSDGRSVSLCPVEIAIEEALSDPEFLSSKMVLYLSFIFFNLSFL